MMHVQTCCFSVANLNLFLLPFLRSPSSSLKNGPEATTSSTNSSPHLDRSFTGGSTILFISAIAVLIFFSLSFIIGCNGSAPQILNSTFVKAILSPGFVANNYGNMQHCQWLIWAPLGYRIHVQFTAFRLQDCQNCSCDNVTIYDGGYLQEPRLGQYCGYDLPPPISSSGNQVLVTFQSDGFYSDGRFRLEYSSKSTGKHLQLRAWNG